jgi:hypothetical protein
MPLPLPNIQVAITGLITPTSVLDTFAVHETWYGRGGFKRALTLIERNSILPDRREANITFCYVESDGHWYQLQGGITNTDWIDLGTSLGGGSGNQNLQQVTNIGNLTTNDIFINELNLFDIINNNYTNIKSDDGDIIFSNLSNGVFFHVNNEGTEINLFKNSDNIQLNFSSITDNRTYTYPDKSGTVALIDDIIEATSNTQFFTINGNNVTNEFVLTHTLNSINILIQVFETTSGNNNTIIVSTRRIDNNNISINFTIPPSNSESFNVLLYKIN